MKNYLVLAFVFTFPILLSSQTIEHNSRSIGLKIVYNGYSGIIGGIDYYHPFSKNMYAKVGLSYGKNIFRAAAGVGLIIPISNKLDIGLGIEYQFNRFDKNQLIWNNGEYKEYLRRENNKSINIAFPISLNYHINSRFTLGLEIYPRISTQGERYKLFKLNELNCGVKYKF